MLMSGIKINQIRGTQIKNDGMYCVAVVLHWLVNRGQSELEAYGGFGIFSCVEGLDRDGTGRDGEGEGVGK